MLRAPREPRNASACEKPFLVFDDATGASDLFSPRATPLARRERSQYDLVFETHLWPTLFDSPDGGAVCFEALFVGVDDRDSLNGSASTFGRVGLAVLAREAPAISLESLQEVSRLERARCHPREMPLERVGQERSSSSRGL